MGSKVKDLTGHVFQRLTVIKQDGWYSRSNGIRHAKWLCQCSCGNITSVISSALIQGRTASCGCAKRDSLTRGLKEGEASFNKLLYTYQQTAKKRGYAFNLSSEEFQNITKQNCYYCGVSPENEVKYPTCNGTYIYNGVDRVDNTKGYEKGNVVACCKRCNTAKSDMTSEEFLNLVKRVYEKHCI